MGREGVKNECALCINEFVYCLCIMYIHILRLYNLSKKRTQYGDKHIKTLNI